MTITKRYRVDQELPGLSFDIPDGAGLPVDLTVYTGKLLFTHPDQPNTLLDDWDTFTLAAAFPNALVAGFTTTPPWPALITAWGKPLPERGTPIICTLQLVRTADSAPWFLEDQLPQIIIWILPAIT